MRKSKIRTLLMSCVMIMLCAAMIVGGTYALWSDSAIVNTHLSAGSLKVGLTRTYLEKHCLGDDMYMTNETDDTVKSFTAPTTENVFGMSDEEFVVPTSYYAARLKLTNNGNVAFDYTISIKVGNTSSKDLAKQIKVYIGTGAVGNVTYDEGKYLATEVDGNVDFTQFTIKTGVMDGEQQEAEFWVKIEFVSDANNNSAMLKEANFDLLVTATQKTEAQA